jgi:hypothetical protein
VAAVEIEAVSTVPAEQSEPEAADEVRPRTRPHPAGESVHAASPSETDTDVRQSAPEAPPPAIVPVGEPVPVVAEGEGPVPVHAEPAHSDPTPSVSAESDPLKPARKGWWQRRVTVD